MDQDGDLDALYETAEFKQSQAVAAQSLYYLNWLRYYGGRGLRRRAPQGAADGGGARLLGVRRRRPEAAIC